MINKPSISTGKILQNSITVLEKQTYWIKSLAKVVVFTMGIFIYFVVTKDKKTLNFMENFKKPLKATIISITVTVVSVVAVFFISRLFIDYNEIINNLTKKNITYNNFLYIGMYIVFVNSFFEEVFFRGFAYLKLREHTSEKIAMVFSAVLFALYHVGIMIGIVGWFKILLIVVFLVIVGLFFNYINSRENNIYNSYLIHSIANLTINAITYILFLRSALP